MTRASQRLSALKRNEMARFRFVALFAEGHQLFYCLHCRAFYRDINCTFLHYERTTSPSQGLQLFALKLLRTNKSIPSSSP